MRFTLPYFVLATILLVTWLVILIHEAKGSVAELWAPSRLWPLIFTGYSSLGIMAAQVSTAAYQLTMLAVAMSAFLVGVFLVSPRVSLESRLRAHPPGPTPVSSARPGTVLLLFVIAFVAFLTATIRAGGLPIFAASVNEARTSFFPNGYFSTIIALGFTVAFIAGLTGSTRPGHWPRRALYLILAVVSALAMVATGNRGFLAMPVLISVVYLSWGKRAHIGRYFVMALAAACLFSFLGFRRNLQSFGPTYLNDLSRQGYPDWSFWLAPAASYVKGTAQTFDLTLSIIPRHIPYSWGSQFFSPLLGTRSVDLWLKGVAGLNFEGFGLAPGAMNAFYIDWGSPGIIVGFFALGVASGLLWRAANDLGGRWRLAYSFWLSNLFLACYGHPFAYLFTLLLPLTLLLVYRTDHAADESSLSRGPRPMLA